MRRFTGYALAVAVVAVLASVALAQRSAPSHRGSHNGFGNGFGGEPAQRWEYATLSFHIVRGNWAWKSPGGVLTGDKGKVFAALGGQGRIQDISYVDVSNQAGQHGWEIVNVLEREVGTEIWFKRPATR